MRLAPALLILSTLPLAACLKTEEPAPTGAGDFAAYCSGCHGAGGRGDGPMATTLGKPPADLTRLAGKDGKIDMARTMSKIYGASASHRGDLMPEFGPLLETDKTVLYDSGDGIPTPTPLRLVKVAEYLQTLQAR